MKLSFLLSFCSICFLNKSFCQIPIGEYSYLFTFSHQRLELFENNRFEYSAGSCEGGIYGKGDYEIDGDLLCLYFQAPQADLKQTKIKKLHKSKDSITIYFTDKFKKLKSLEFTCYKKNNKILDTAIRTGLNDFIKLPRSYLPIRLSFYNLELIDCPLTFKKPGVFWIEVSVTREMIAKKLNYTMLNEPIVFKYKILENSDLYLNRLHSKFPFTLYHK